jgi:hypothetical protein
MRYMFPKIVTHHIFPNVYNQFNSTNDNLLKKLIDESDQNFESCYSLQKEQMLNRVFIFLLKIKNKVKLKIKIFKKKFSRR